MYSLYRLASRVGQIGSSFSSSALSYLWNGLPVGRAALASLLPQGFMPRTQCLATSASSAQSPGTTGPGGKTKVPLAISLPGYGTGFFWQAGALHYLSQHIDLRQVPMRASSGGAFVALLSACGVQPERAVDEAFSLCLEHRIYEQPLGLGLLGTWGFLIRAWLDTLLPADAHTRCAHVGLMLTRVPSLRAISVSDFASRQELIDAALASAHVPLLLDWRLVATFRGVQYIDGNLQYGLWGDPTGLVEPGDLIFDPRQDPQLWSDPEFGCFKLLTREVALKCVRRGYCYARELHEAGALEGYSYSPAGAAVAETTPVTSAESASVNSVGTGPAGAGGRSSAN